MTVATRINALVLSVSVLAGALLTSITLLRDYSLLKSQLIERSFDRVQSQPQLQVAVYFDDREEQQAMLTDLLQSSGAIRYALLRTTGGETLGVVGAPPARLARLDQLRSGRADAETGIASRHSKVSSDGAGQLLNAFGGDVVWDLTVPVLSVVNPLVTNISRQELGAALANSRSVSSLHVIAYVQLGVSRFMLVRQALSRVTVVAGMALVFIVLTGILSRTVTRRITAPFSTLKRMAGDIAVGNALKYEGIEKSGEFRDIVALLNSMIGGLHTYKTRMDVNHQLLSMKVEERTSQLSRRNEELNQAVREVTETKNRLKQMAYYDSLTLLPNRRLFTEQLDLLLRLSRRNKEKIALLFIDLDNFKRINDSLGHSAGDLLLREAAKRLARCVRESDLVAHYVEAGSQIDVSRLGGDEFTVVLNQLDHAESAGMVALRLIQALAQPMTIDGHELVITPSIGIAIAPDDADSVEDLLRASDKAMYQCKTSGKNQFMYYDSSMDAAGIERLTLEYDLRRAIERGDLLLHYQPQVDTMTGAVVGAEALMRWQHPELGFVPPYKFIPLAEELGLIGALGKWGLEEACRQMVELQTEGLELPQVSVNVSALQFNQGFIREVVQILSETGLHPKRLKLELTEGIMVDDTAMTIEALSRVKELGVRLSIDDFGTGYSSLSYLSRLPLDELKIDRSFVIDIEKGKHHSSLVIAIIALARSMGLQVVAEGVETREQYHFLRNHGASVIQGYLFSKPVPLDELKLLLVPGVFKEQLNLIDLVEA